MVYGKNGQSICRVGGVANEAVAHICVKMLKTSAEGIQISETYNIVKMIHSKLCEESEDRKILRDFPIQTDKTLDHNQPDITVVDKKSKKCLLIDPACPLNTRTERREAEKCTNYSELNYKIARIWKMGKVKDIPVVIGALGTLTKLFEKWIEKLTWT